MGVFPAALARGAVALRDVLVSGGPGISAEAGGARRLQLVRHRKNNSNRNAHYLPLETFLKLEGCGWRHPDQGKVPWEACLRMPGSLATPAGGSLTLQGDNFVVFKPVGYSMLVSVQY